MAFLNLTVDFFLLQAARYEQWLEQQETNINNQLKYYETEIAKLRKQKKVSKYLLITIMSFQLCIATFLGCIVDFKISSTVIKKSFIKVIPLS